MQRYQFLKIEKEFNNSTNTGPISVEYAYILDTQTGEVLKTIVKSFVGGVFGAASGTVGATSDNKSVYVPPTNNALIAKAKEDVVYDENNPAPRTKKVPPAFMGNMNKMYNSPESGRETDVTHPV